MQILNGVITPVILTFILVMANRRSLLGDAVNSPRFRFLATACIVVIAAMAIFVALQTASTWLGFGP